MPCIEWNEVGVGDIPSVNEAAIRVFDPIQNRILHSCDAYYLYGANNVKHATCETMAIVHKDDFEHDMLDGTR